MAAVPSSPETLIPKSTSPPPSTPHPAAPDPSASSTPPPSAAADLIPPPEAALANLNPHPNPNPAPLTPPLPQFTPSFRPVGAPQAPQFSPVVGPGFQNPSFQVAAVQNSSLQPPGVTPGFAVPGAASGVGAVTVSVQPVPPPGAYYAAPGLRPYWQGPNGYLGAPAGQGPGMMMPPGIPRYPPYPAMVRPGFPPRPLMHINVIPTISRPPAPGIGGAPIVPPMARPVVPIVALTEKPQTTVYVGKIASTVENSFLLSLLELCGPVKNWKPAQNPSDGSLRGFGFCEFESAEGVLRAMRLLTKLNLDGQELVLNVNQATREYLERYVEKKTEREKLKEAETDSTNKVSVSSSVEMEENQNEEKPERDVGDAEGKNKQADIHKFGIVTDEDRETDREAVKKLKNVIEERLKAKPLPPPPPVNIDGSARVNSELPTKSRDGDMEIDVMKIDDKMDEDITSDNKVSFENDKTEGNSSDKTRRRDRSRERDRERDFKREKDRELERYERERERERVRRERERDLKTRETERQYKDRIKEWEAREREKEHQRHYEREREKERDGKRRREIMDQEDESDDDDARKRRRRSALIEERRRKRQREKEDDLADKLKEEEEIAEAKKRAAEEQESKQKQKDESEFLPLQVINVNGVVDMLEDKKDVSGNENISDKANEGDLAATGVTGESIQRNGSMDESNVLSEAKQNNITSRKLGFGLVASGKRSFIPSIFNEEDDEDMDDKKMRPFVPIDYTEELEVAQNISGTPPNLVAAAEYAKRISGGNSKDEKAVLDKERSRRSNERHKDRVRNDDNHKHFRDDSREQVRDRNLVRDRERDNKKLLDAKQLIDTIPKTKEELFSYDINWAVYDKHELHERMRPWITKKITDFLGEEETSLVDYIVSSTNNHVKASDMLELLQSILDEEAEMFVLKMWRMLIFEIKKVETGLSLKSKA